MINKKYVISKMNKKSIKMYMMTQYKNKNKIVQTVARFPEMATAVEEKKEDFFENDMSCFFYNEMGHSEMGEGIGSDDYYLPTVGMTNCVLNEHNELKQDQANIYFKILDKYNVPYAIFAGSSIGLLRNGKTIPWSDDYDVIILNNDLNRLYKVFPILRKHGFKIIQNKSNITNNYTNGGCSVFSNSHKYVHMHEDQMQTPQKEGLCKRSGFSCDIFYSHIDKNGFLRNNGLWGLYHVKNLHISSVVPFRRHVFDGIPLPFFNNVKLEVYKTYGNTDEEALIKTHLKVSSSKSKYTSWRRAYEEFENRKMKAIQNTIQKIFKNGHHSNHSNDSGDADVAVAVRTNDSLEKKKNVMKIMDDKFNKNQVEMLSEIEEKNIGRIYVFSVDFIIQHAASIKFYFPDIVIEYFSYAREVEVILYLNYVDKLHVYNSMIEAFYNDPSLIYLNKPKIDVIKVITFGTFDLWHMGHSNILSRCCKYSENICVGVSSDEFTFQKKQIYPTDSFKTRSDNVKKCKFVKKVFEETSMEMKNDYIQLCSANILVMGDDWQDKFDWVDCCVIYLPRTPNISSTMLREQMSVKFSKV